MAEAGFDAAHNGENTLRDMGISPRTLGQSVNVVEREVTELELEA